MEKVIILILILGMMITGCGPPPQPIKPDDAYMYLNMKRRFVKQHAQRAPVKFVPDGDFDLGGLDINCDEECIIVILGCIVVFYLAYSTTGVIKRSINNLKGTDIHVYPEGYREYRQRVKWGRNKVYLPKELLKKQFKLCIDITGSFTGKGSIQVNPDEVKREVRKELNSREKNGTDGAIH